MVAGREKTVVITRTVKSGARPFKAPRSDGRDTSRLAVKYRGRDFAGGDEDFLSMTQHPHFLRISCDLTRCSFRGTDLAIGALAMQTTANMTVNIGPTPDDWVEAHGDYLFNFATGQLRDASVAEDLVQDTFLAAFKARDRFASQSSERTWLVGILRHKIYDHLRRACRERAFRADADPPRRD